MRPNPSIAASFVSLILMLSAGCHTPRRAAEDPPHAGVDADVVLLDGRILTLDAHDSVGQALAIRDGNVVAVGRDTDIVPLIGDTTTVIQLGGRTVIPGIIQTHSHALGVARQILSQPHAELTSIAQVQAWIRAKAARTPPGEWIQVPRSDITRLAERRHPTPAELDAACTTHPVAFNAARKWALNTLGFETARIEEANISGARILRDPSGHPRLVAGADTHIQNLLPGPSYTQGQYLDALAEVLRRYNEVGITSIFERATDRAGYLHYQELRRRGDLTTRVTLTFRRTMRTTGDVRRFVDDLELSPGEGDAWIKAGPLKIVVDGGIHWGNTHLREPYGQRRATFYAHDDPSYQGTLHYSVDEMRDVFTAAHRLGWQMCCHVTGDAGVDRVLDALDASHRELPVDGRRFTLVHAYFPTPDAIERGRRLGVCVDTQVDLYFKDSEAIAEVYGPDWADRFIGVGDWLRGGVRVAINGDHMMGLDPDRAMNSFNPFLHMYIAVSRKNNCGRVYGPHQKVSRLDALRAMTTTAAHLSFDESTIGSLEPGKRADLAVLDRDYLTCPEEAIRTIKVLLTMTGGRVVHGRTPFSKKQGRAPAE